jgi:hypothetical protein
MEDSNGENLMPVVQRVYFMQNLKYHYGNITLVT